MHPLIRVYDTFNQADRVVRELQSAGVASDSISLVAGDNSAQITSVEDIATAGAGVGAAFGGGAFWLFQG
jgi:heat induced stress protein YflT